MPEKHRAGASPAEPMPLPVDFEPFLCGLFPARDLVSYLRSENLCSPSGQHIQPGFPENFQNPNRALTRKAGKMEDLDRGKTFEGQSGAQFAKGLNHIHVIRERKRWMKPADNVDFGNSPGQSLTDALDDLFHRQFKPIAVSPFSGKGTERTVEDAVVGVVDVAVDDIRHSVSVQSLASGHRGCG